MSWIPPTWIDSAPERILQLLEVMKGRDSLDCST